MKKVIFFLISFLLATNVVSASSERIYVGDKIPGMFIRKIDESGKITNKQGGFLRRVSDNAFVYCLEPFIALIDGDEYEEYSKDFLDDLNISEEVWEDISLIAYYGYMYDDHTEDYWYYITQMMIWRKVAPNAQFYFTDTLGGNINNNLYQDEIKEIESLVSRHKLLPALNDVNLLYGEDTIITDASGVLSDYEIIEDFDLVQIQDNKLKINGNKIGSFAIELVKKSDNYETSALVYIDSESQKAMAVGNIPDQEIKININIIPCQITVFKKDYDTLENLNIAGIKFLLYDEEHNLVSTTETNADGILIFNNLKVGKYYLKEDDNQVITGYMINDEYLDINLNTSNINVDFYNKKITGQIKIIKYQEEFDQELKYVLASDIEFGLYDMFDNLIRTNKTNQDGEIIFDNLELGKYKIKELTKKDDYIVSDDFIVEVKIVNNEGSVEEIKVYNELKKGKVKVIKYKELANKDMALAKNIEIGLYDQNKNLIKVGTTNEYGEVVFDNLVCGKYYVRELSNLVEYELDENYYKVIVKENSEEEIIISNYLKKGKLIINKIGDNNLPLEGTGFNIFNEDGALIFSGLTNNLGVLEVLELPLGSYYIKESVASPGYQVLNDKIYFNILESSEVITVNITNKKISIKVPDTGMYLEEIILFIDKKRFKLA